MCNLPIYAYYVLQLINVSIRGYVVNSVYLICGWSSRLRFFFNSGWGGGGYSKILVNNFIVSSGLKHLQ